MTFEIDFNQSPDYVYIRTAGKASVDGFDKILTGIVNSPNWKTGMKQLVDHSNLQVKYLNSSDMQQILEIVKKNSTKLGNGKCAFVMKNELGFGMARMYELIGGEKIHQGISVFYDINKAIEWLKE